MAERMKIPNRKKQKAGSRAKHRLRSIDRDVRAMEDLFHCRGASSLDTSYGDSSALVTHALHHWKVIPNERCGTWYVPPVSETQLPPTTDNSGQPHCYFKSTDGHSQVWEFSLKRLNLSLLEQCIAQDGGCLLVDSSVRKLLPDSFSKTLPIWACVWNRILLRYKTATKKFNDNSNDKDDVMQHNSNDWWDTSLYTPRGVISKDEHETIASLMEDRVETLFRSGAIVNPSRLLERLTKPLRVVWMNHEGKLYSSHENDEKETIFVGPTQALTEILQKYFVIVCWNPSRYRTSKNGRVPTHPQSKEELVVALEKHQTEWIREEDEIDNDNDNDNDNETPLETAGSGRLGYYYTPGAADDHESWAQHLTPALFWKHREALLNHALDEDEIDDLITVLVAQDKTAQEQQQQCQEEIDTVEEARKAVYSYSDRIGETNLWIGSRRASRPPECWSAFDAILNVTHQEYDDMLLQPEHENDDQQDRFYLQLPVQEGKRDRTQLEQWMPVGLAFLIRHLQQGRRVLVHCAQGKDRSVAVALIFVAMVCPLQFPLQFKPEFQRRLWDLSALDCTINGSSITLPKNNSSNGQPCHDDSDDSVEGARSSNASTEKEVSSNAKGQLYRSSGLSEAMVQRLLQAGGKELFLLWIHRQLNGDAINNNTNSSSDIGIPETPKYKCLADKEGVRIALHLIKQDREVAEPTRSTMQKIHRFLMSSSIYR